MIYTDKAPKPLGAYSQAVEHNNTLYISGQLPIDPIDTEKMITDVKEQTRQTLANLEAILIAAGSSKEKVLKVTIYITDIAIWGDVNTVYGEFFGGHKPARAAVPVKDLPKGYQIEIEAVAFI